MKPSSNGEIMKVGNRASLSKVFSEQDVTIFAGISSDRNPIHLNEVFATHTRFGHRIVHGMLTAGLISAVLGTQLPGPGSIYLSQTLEFRAPVYIGDRITACVEIIAVRKDKPIVTLTTICKNQHDEIVIAGEAVLLVS